MADVPGGLPGLLESTGELLDSYFALEDPRRLEPAEREVLVEGTLPSGVHLKGFVDRLDRSPAGDLRVVDYKSGKSPRRSSRARRCSSCGSTPWCSGARPVSCRGCSGSTTCVTARCSTTPPTPPTSRRWSGRWTRSPTAITKARETGDFRHKPSKLCDWCAHQAICPAFGGTPPPLPPPEVVLTVDTSPGQSPSSQG